ncbi:hypothetical protein HCN44_001378 [Aphidius gifuensis]|uniref:Crossover junction endonuclease MUS81 n=1 Tax=Aphidius gifuensis TaxID=684658 RepID=A0A834XRD6_APHGI|nr:hypothetical protein HCN44_001378 [Aphidius gifuensis]
MKRIKKVPLQPNKLFEEWLEEWREALKEKSPQHYIGLSKALSSLKKYPLKLESGKDCIIIEHFGKKLCDLIDTKLANHLKTQAEFDYNHVINNIGTIYNNPGLKRKIPQSRGPSPVSKKSNNNKQVVQHQHLLSPSPSPPPRAVPAPTGPPQPQQQQHVNPTTALRLKPYAFDIYLIVDSHEVDRGKQAVDQTTNELKKTGILFETRHLNVGDFTWIARCKSTGKELVLPYIVERKRIDDFSGSVNDGRFRIENVIYLVENRAGYEKSDYGMPISRLRQAATNTMIQDGFTVRYTRDHRDSMLYLATVTSSITRKYEAKELVECEKNDLVPSSLLGQTIYLLEFQKFDQAGAKIKALKVKDMFVRQLIKLKGLSLAKVSAIINRYPSPLALKRALENTTTGEKMLATIPYGSTNKNIGPAIAKIVYQLYTKNVLY